MNKKQINYILKKYKEVFDIIENYDKTRELPFQKKRIDITLSIATINKLKQMSLKSKKPISHIIEEHFSR